MHQTKVKLTDFFRLIFNDCDLDKKKASHSTCFFCLKRVKRSKIEVKAKKRSTIILILGFVKIDM